MHTVQYENARVYFGHHRPRHEWPPSIAASISSGRVCKAPCRPAPSRDPAEIGLSGQGQVAGIHGRQASRRLQSERGSWTSDGDAPRLGIERVWPLVLIGQCAPTDTIVPKRLPSARQWRQGRIRSEAEYRRRTEFLPRLQFRARKVRLVGAVGEMLRLKREPLSLAIGRTG